MSIHNIQGIEGIKTPFYYYDLSILEATLKTCKEESGKYDFHVHYAMKANVNDRILELIKKYGFEADCVSGNEVLKAISVGFKPEHIAFAGVGKTDEEITLGIEKGIFSFNVESIPELEIINEIAGKMGKKANIALRLNPNVNANTHHYITTGLEENKFGINSWELDDVVATLKKSPNLNLVGLHFHIGSQITDMSVFKNLCSRVNELQEWFISRGFVLPHLNLGGGLGIDYYHPNEHLIPDFATYFKVFDDFLKRIPNQQVHFELGRALVAQCGSLITRVVFVKKGLKTNFLIVDAGMTELIRPALYQAYHKIEHIGELKTEVGGRKSEDGSQRAEDGGQTSDIGLRTSVNKYDVVGPICESSDCFAKAMELPETKRGDLLAIRSAGAYGEVMSSNYNLREKPVAVYS